MRKVVDAEYRWENYSLRHHFSPAVGPAGMYDGVGRIFIQCRDCMQTRWVWDGDTKGHFLNRDVYGCAIVPFWYRLRMFVLGKSIPQWSVNSKPPWIR